VTPKGFARRLLSPELLLAAVTVLACTAVLVAVEVLARRLDPHYLDRVRGTVISSERYGSRARPGFAAHLHGVPTTVNARGYRGALHPHERTPGKTRLLMLGDSIAFGSRVRDFETFSSLVERPLARYEVVNVAVEGYGTDQELLLLEEEGLRYHPDLVVLNVCVANDPRENFLPGRLPWPKPYFTWNGRRLVLHDDHLRLSPPLRAIQWLSDESYLLNRLRELLPLASDPRPLPPVRGEWRRFDRSAANELTIRLACQVRDVARRGAADFLVLLHPDEPTFKRRSRVARTLGSATSRSRSISRATSRPSAITSSPRRSRPSSPAIDHSDEQGRDGRGGVKARTNGPTMQKNDSGPLSRPLSHLYDL
jgi:hypothetical protein